MDNWLNSVTKQPLPTVAWLDKKMDIVKSTVFQQKNAAFFGPLLCNLEFYWDNTMPTAATNGVKLWFSPSYFVNLPVDSLPTELMHEIGHTARLHFIRKGNRELKLWNIACDIVIDLDLETDGYTFEGVPGVLSWPRLNARRFRLADGSTMAEEQIYAILEKEQPDPPPSCSAGGDMREPTKEEISQMISAAIQAVHAAKQAGKPGSIPGGLEVFLENFLAPVVPWELYLHEFMQGLIAHGSTMRRPNRRYLPLGIYLPSVQRDPGLLAHLAFIQDVSGSISDEMNRRFSSEMKYVHQKYRPKLMTHLQFDTEIKNVKTIDRDDPFESMKITGRGGTHLECVRQWIMENKPTAAVIFSDMECAPMQDLDVHIPILWVAIGNRSATVPFGKLIHIKE